MSDKFLLKEQLIYFMQSNYKGFMRSRWEGNISRLVTNFLKTVRVHKIPVFLSNIDTIQITQKELESIQKINDLRLEKISFIMLVYAKISNINLKRTDGWINQSCSTILKEARVSLKGEDKKKIFHQLYKINYISQSNKTDKTQLKINYIDEKSDVVINISNFNDRETVYDYILWKNPDMVRCENCGKPIIQTTPNKKYCSQCAKEIHKEQDREYQKSKYYSRLASDSEKC